MAEKAARIEGKKPSLLNLIHTESKALQDLVGTEVGDEGICVNAFMQVMTHDCVIIFAQEPSGQKDEAIPVFNKSGKQVDNMIGIFHESRVPRIEVTSTA